MWLGTIWHNDCIQGCLWKLQRKMQEKKIALIFFWSIIVASSHLKARQVVQSGNWEFSLKCLLVLVMHQNVPDMITHTSETFATKTISPTKKGVTLLWCDCFCSYQPFLGPAISIWCVKKNIPSMYGTYIYIYICMYVHLNFPEKSTKCRWMVWEIRNLPRLWAVFPHPAVSRPCDGNTSTRSSCARLASFDTSTS